MPVRTLHYVSVHPVYVQWLIHTVLGTVAHYIYVRSRLSVFICVCIHV